jgi:hypothetical protein
MEQGSYKMVRARGAAPRRGPHLGQMDYKFILSAETRTDKGQVSGVGRAAIHLSLDEWLAYLLEPCPRNGG